MSRRLAVLAGMCVLGVFAGVASAAGPTGGGNPPPGGTPPFDPPPPPAGSSAAGCAVQETHPIPCRLFTVSCSSSPSSSVCTTTGLSGSQHAAVQKLALRLPRRFVAIAMTCRIGKLDRITCRVTSRTTGTAAGTRIVVLRLPSHFEAVHISCGTRPYSGFACRLTK